MTRRQPFGPTNRPIVPVSGASSRRRHRDRSSSKSSSSAAAVAGSKRAAGNAAVGTATAVTAGATAAAASKSRSDPSCSRPTSTSSSTGRSKPKSSSSIANIKFKSSLDAAALAVDDSDSAIFSTTSTSSSTGTPSTCTADREKRWRKEMKRQQQQKEKEKQKKEQQQKEMQKEMQKQKHKKKTNKGRPPLPPPPPSQQHQQQMMMIGMAAGGNTSTTNGAARATSTVTTGGRSRKGSSATATATAAAAVAKDNREGSRNGRVDKENGPNVSRNLTTSRSDRGGSGGRGGLSSSSSSSGRRFDSHDAITPKINNRLKGRDDKIKKGTSKSGSIGGIGGGGGLSAAPTRTPSKIVGRTEPLQSTSAKKKKRQGGGGGGTGGAIEIYQDPLPPASAAAAAAITNTNQRIDRRRPSGMDIASTGTKATATKKKSTKTAVATRKPAPRPDFLPPKPPGLDNTPPAALPTDAAPSPTESLEESLGSNASNRMDCSQDDRGIGLSSPSGSEGSEGNDDDSSPELKDKIVARSRRVEAVAEPGGGVMGRRGEDGGGLGSNRPRFAFRSPDTVRRAEEERQAAAAAAAAGKRRRQQKDDEEVKADIAAASATVQHHSTKIIHRPKPSHRSQPAIPQPGQPVASDILDRARQSKPDNGNVMDALMQSDGGRTGRPAAAAVSTSNQSVTSRSTAFKSIAHVGATIELRRSTSLDESEMTMNTESYATNRQQKEEWRNPTVTSSHGRTAEVDDDDDCSIESEQSEMVYTERHLALIREQLPPGWIVRMSRSKGKPYYKHPDFGTTWYCPVNVDLGQLAPPTPPTPANSSESGSSVISPASATSLQEQQNFSPPGSELSGRRGRGSDASGSTGRLSDNFFDTAQPESQEARVEVVQTHAHGDGSQTNGVRAAGSLDVGPNDSFEPTGDAQDDMDVANKDDGEFAFHDDGDDEEEHQRGRDQMSPAKAEDVYDGYGDECDESPALLDHPKSEQLVQQKEQSPSVSVVSSNEEVVSVVGLTSKEGLAKLLEQVSELPPTDQKPPANAEISDQGGFHSSEQLKAEQKLPADAEMSDQSGFDEYEQPKAEQKPTEDNQMMDQGGFDGGEFPTLDGGDDDEEKEEIDDPRSPALLSPKEKKRSVCDSPTDSFNLFDDQAGEIDDVSDSDSDDVEVVNDKKDDIATVKFEKSKEVKEETSDFIQEIEVSSDTDDLSSIHVAELPRKRKAAQGGTVKTRGAVRDDFDNDNASVYSWRTHTGPDRPLCSLQQLDHILEKQKKPSKKRRASTTTGTGRKKKGKKKKTTKLKNEA